MQIGMTTRKRCFPKQVVWMTKFWTKFLHRELPLTLKTSYLSKSWTIRVVKNTHILVWIMQNQSDLSNIRNIQVHHFPMLHSYQILILVQIMHYNPILFCLILPQEESHLIYLKWICEKHVRPSLGLPWLVVCLQSPRSLIALWEVDMLRN